jgi:PKD repeat protein
MNLRYVQQILLSLGIFLLAGALPAAAQCGRVGWVASVTPGCGVKIIDLDNGQILRAFEGSAGLMGGQTIRFDAVPTALPPGCNAEGFPTVALSCLSDTLPCVAQFGWFVDAQDAFQVHFEASVYDADAQHCAWNFGDGTTATGNSTQHVFAGEGDYEVCLTVSDDFGCAQQICKTVHVSAQNPNDCGYAVHVTAVGATLHGKLYQPLYNPDWAIETVEWYMSKSPQVISTNPTLTMPLPGYGSYLVCAQYQIRNTADGSLCATTRCQPLEVVEPGCKNPVLDEISTLCLPVFAPVCGCDGITYGNECEAQGAGVSTWWAGTCGEAMNQDCMLEMEAKVIAGNPDLGYWVQFVRSSPLNFAFAQLDFGDGTPLWEGVFFDTITHHYPNGGIYKTNLSGWVNSNCVSSMTQLVFTDALSMSPENMPPGTDYVMPGDANGDRKANVADLLNIGVGHYSSGSPRPNAHTAWAPQFAPNWPYAVAQAVNYKHLDCDGNGYVNALDADIILEHYAALDTLQLFPVSNAPKLWVDFPQDTVYVDEANPMPLAITANVMLGTPLNPALDIYGLAFALKYPDFVNHNLSANYDESSIFGFNHNLWLPKDNHERLQLDLGLTRTNGQAVSGYGPIAELTLRSDFIIIIDVTDRSDARVIPFTMPVRSLLAIDAQGNEKELSVGQDTVWIKRIGTVSAADAPRWDARVTLFPNPARDQVRISAPDAGLEQVEVFNALGQKVHSQNCSGDNAIIPLEGWLQGVYTVRILGERGIVERKLTVK